MAGFNQGGVFRERSALRSPLACSDFESLCFTPAMVRGGRGHLQGREIFFRVRTLCSPSANPLPWNMPD
jgi:hypothetical protein